MISLADTCSLLYVVKVSGTGIAVRKRATVRM